MFVLWWQIEEEPEVFGHRSSHVVHTHCPRYIQAIYQVKKVGQLYSKWEGSDALCRSNHIPYFWSVIAVKNKDILSLGIIIISLLMLSCF